MSSRLLKLIPVLYSCATFSPHSLSLENLLMQWVVKLSSFMEILCKCGEQRLWDADQSHTLCCVFCLDLLILHLHLTQGSCGKQAVDGPTFNFINGEGLAQVNHSSTTKATIRSQSHAHSTTLANLNLARPSFTHWLWIIYFTCSTEFTFKS